MFLAASPASRARGGRSGAPGPGRGGPSTTVRSRRIGEDWAMSPTDRRPPSRLRLTAYAACAAGALGAVAPRADLRHRGSGRWRSSWSASLLLLVAVPAGRWIADQHRPMAGRVLGTTIPDQYRPRTPRRALVERVSGWALDPMTWRDLAWLLVACTLGFVISLIGGAAAGAGRHRRPVVVRDRADHARPRAHGPLDALLRPHRGARAAGAGAHRDPRRGRRPLGRRAAPDRARPARRRPGTPGRAVDEPRHGREPDGERPRDGARR